jgi:hypothetical protein
LLKNILLVLANVPFSVACLICFPIYALQAGSALLFGEFSGGMNPSKLLFLLGYATLVGIAARMIVKRFRSAHPAPLQLTTASDRSLVSCE